ncbi:MAG: PspA/IM30 family protein [Candidatus Dormibacteraeota bacterium]|nr:PspA/IM30 family protein [Candidatus Dormibacteraeota bacterium]
MPELELALEAAVACAALVVGWRSRVGRRLRQIVEQKVGHRLDRAENPVEALDLSYRKQREALQSVRRGIAEVVTSQKRLEIQVAQLRQADTRLRDQARRALQEGREDLARLALTRAADTAGQIASIQQQIAQINQQELALEATSQKLESRVMAFKTRRDTISAQYSAARASAKIGETVTGLSADLGGVGRSLERIQEKTSQMQARAAALEQLMDQSTLGTLGPYSEDDIDRELRLGAANASVEAELSRLRREALASSPEHARIAGAPTADVNSEKGG